MLAFHFHAVMARTLTALVLCLALLAAGCVRKPERTAPTVLVPSIEAEPQPAPPQPVSSESANPAPEPAPTTGAAPNNAQKPKPKPRKPAARKPEPTKPAEQPKPEPVIPAAPDHSVQITADVPRAAVQSQKQNTEQLLRDSEGKLAGIQRSLGESEQGMLRQARNYITQSNQALQSGEIERAYNLAVKANLLSNELTRYK